MEHSKENIVKLLRKASDNCMEVSRIMPKLKQQMINRALAYDVAAMVITDEKYFNALCKAYDLTTGSED